MDTQVSNCATGNRHDAEYDDFLRRVNATVRVMTAGHSLDYKLDRWD